MNVMRATASLLAFALIGACTPEDQNAELRLLLEKAEQAAESRDLGFYRDLISENYVDRRGQHRDQVIDMIRGYFFLNADIEVVNRVQEITVVADGAAEVVLQAALIGRAENRSLLAADGDLYELELELVREGSAWRVIGADWTRVL